MRAAAVRTTAATRIAIFRHASELRIAVMRQENQRRNQIFQEQKLFWELAIAALPLVQQPPTPGVANVVPAMASHPLPTAAVVNVVAEVQPPTPEVANVVPAMVSHPLPTAVVVNVVAEVQSQSTAGSEQEIEIVDEYEEEYLSGTDDETDVNYLPPPNAIHNETSDTDDDYLA